MHIKLQFFSTIVLQIFFLIENDRESTKQNTLCRFASKFNRKHIPNPIVIGQSQMMTSTYDDFDVTLSALVHCAISKEAVSAVKALCLPTASARRRQLLQTGAD